MARKREKPLTRNQAIAWCATLYVLSVIIGSALVLWAKYNTGGALLFLGFLLHTAVFACAFVSGVRADPGAIRKSADEALRALIEPAPFHTVAILLIAAALFFIPGFGWPWCWRTVIPWSAGIVAGYKWARQEVSSAPKPKPAEEEEPPPIDLWKP